MLEIIDVNYESLSGIKSEELYTLRKKTFKDRLKWAVSCVNNIERDEYDNANTQYLLGAIDGQLVCSVRFIETRFPNMITNTFHNFFKKLELPPGNFVESSRFFVDKKRAKELLDNRFPISSVLFLAMINYTRHCGYQGIYTICNKPMWKILQRSGWEIEIIEEGRSEMDKPLYMLFLPIDGKNQQILASRIGQQSSANKQHLICWPMTLRSMTELV
ncbi:acyl-homoserine-lactone synthase [Enterobacteriaceae bacterium LUAb1]